MRFQNVKDAGVKNPQKVCRLAKILYTLILNMEPIKLKCIISVELKDASGTGQMKTKLG